MTRHCIAIATGGTGGHVRPALAFAEAYRELRSDGECILIGGASGFERSLATAHGYRFEVILAHPVARAGILPAARAIANLPLATRQARRLLQEMGAQLVIGFGGYASVAPLLAGRSLGLPTVVFECNVVPGLANLLLGQFVDRVGLGSPQKRAYFRAAKTRLIGVPLGRALLRSAAEKTRQRVAAQSTLAVIGASEGSPFLNQNVPPLVRTLVDRGWEGTVLHQSGAGHADRVAERYAALGLRAEVVPFVESMTGIYERTSVAIACAGASTLAELALYQIPALVVPYSAAAWNHQRANAAAFAGATGVPWVTESAWDNETVAQRLLALWSDDDALLALRARLARAARPEAGRHLAELCAELVVR